MSDLILPTDEQVERAARIICEELGFDPDAKVMNCILENAPSPELRLQRYFLPSENYIRPLWWDYALIAKCFLLNKDKILGETPVE